MSLKSIYNVDGYSVERRALLLSNLFYVKCKNCSVNDFFRFTDRNVIFQSYYNQVYVIFTQKTDITTHIYLAVSDKIIRVFKGQNVSKQKRKLLKGILTQYKQNGALGIYVSTFTLDGIASSNNELLTDIQNYVYMFSAVVKLLDMYLIYKKRSNLEDPNPVNDPYLYTFKDFTINKHLLSSMKGNVDKINESWNFYFKLLFESNVEKGIYYKHYFDQLKKPITATTFGYDAMDYYYVYDPLLNKRFSNKEILNIMNAKNIEKIYKLDCAKRLRDLCYYFISMNAQPSDITPVPFCTNPNTVIFPEVWFKAYVDTNNGTARISVNTPLKDLLSVFTQNPNKIIVFNIITGVHDIVKNESHSGHRTTCVIERSGRNTTLYSLDTNYNTLTEYETNTLMQIFNTNTTDVLSWQMPSLDTMYPPLNVQKFFESGLSMFLVNHIIYTSLEFYIPLLKFKGGTKVCVETIHTVLKPIRDLPAFKETVQGGMCFSYGILVQHLIANSIHQQNIPFLMACLFANTENIMMNAVIKLLVFYFSCGFYNKRFSDTEILHVGSFDSNRKCLEEIRKILN